MRELGPDGLARFLRLAKPGAGDYTRDREQWQENLTLDQILESIRKQRVCSRASISVSFARWEIAGYVEFCTRNGAEPATDFGGYVRIGIGRLVPRPCPQIDEEYSARWSPKKSLQVQVVCRHLSPGYRGGRRSFCQQFCQQLARNLIHPPEKLRWDLTALAA